MTVIGVHLQSSRFGIGQLAVELGIVPEDTYRLLIAPGRAIIRPTGRFGNRLQIRAERNILPPSPLLVCLWAALHNDPRLVIRY